jgi:hypothetical protein
MPARSISRWDTISASLGVSFRIGRKYRESCIRPESSDVWRHEPIEWANARAASAEPKGPAHVLCIENGQLRQIFRQRIQ